MKLALKRTFLCMMLALCGELSLQAVEKLPPEAFLLQVAKVGAAQRSASILNGRLQYYRKNSGRVETYPIRFAIRFADGETRAFLTLGEEERYRMERNAFLRTHQFCPAETGVILQKSGLSPDDLVMGFLDGEFISEDEPDTLKTVPCRVLNLRGKNGETVKVWIASEYCFPLKAEFYRDAESFGEAPQKIRTLELTGFKKVEDRYVPTDMAVLAPEFRTRVALNECEILQESDARIPALFPKMEQAEQPEQVEPPAKD